MWIYVYVLEQQRETGEPLKESEWETISRERVK
jgi:hypothetical protein